MVDVIVKLNLSGSVLAITWYNEELRRAWQGYRKAYENQVFSHLSLSAPAGSLWWGPRRFRYKRLSTGTESVFLLLEVDNHISELLCRAFDCLDDGVQIYDEDATLIYLNSTSRKMSGFADYNYPVEGKNLMDLYQVTDESSTALTALRTKRPVINRFAKFQTAEGKTIITCNTGYPLVREDGHFLGVVVLEQNANVLRKKKEHNEKISLAMEQEITSGLYAKDPSSYTFEDYVGSSVQVREAVALAQSVAAKESNVLLLGETGTGKEIFAQAIHHDSLRSKKKFVAINCSAVPEQLVESILFGTEKGSFTGSVEKKGLFEEADGGTIFLDELNSMSLAMQAKLLRVLQENSFRRVGGNREIKVNVRVVASCNEDVFQLIRENKLRRDLFYRVATIMIALPPLRDHLDDMETLIWHRIHHSKLKYALQFTKISDEVIWLLQQYRWPGNVRELNHVVDYAMTVSDGEIMLKEHLPTYILDAVCQSKNLRLEPKESPEILPFSIAHIDRDLKSMMRDFEQQVIQKALQQTQGNITQAAKLLGLNRQNLQYRLRRYKNLKSVLF